MSTGSSVIGINHAKTFVYAPRLRVDGSPSPAKSSRGILSNAHSFVMNQPHLIDQSRTTINKHQKNGMHILLQSCIPEAAHDAGAREYAPRCHTGTRQSFIKEITNWSSEPKQRRMLWMKGPAGVGKSAVAQSCAEAQDHLGAAFFFSRPNKVIDPKRFFPSVAYQLATQHDAYRQILDERIAKDPSVVTKSLSVQFHQLLVAPLQKLKESGSTFEGKLIIVDGLDECEGQDFQCNIVEIISSSVSNRTTPFIWAFFSRPEAHINNMFNSPTLQPLTLCLELPVSSDSSPEIRRLLVDELRNIQRSSGLPASWPPPEAVDIIVRLSAGLFIYASTVLRFINDPDSLGPESQLEVVLSLEHSGSSPVLENERQHPLSELDLFYTLIMRRVPQKTLTTLREILFLLDWIQGSRDAAMRVANLLKLSTNQLYAILRPLHSVLSVEEGFLSEVSYYHASFQDFLRDPLRSREFCLELCKPGLAKKLLVRMEKFSVVGNESPRRERKISKRDEEVAKTWLRLLGSGMKLDQSSITALLNFDFRLFSELKDFQVNFHVEGLWRNLPKDVRRRIIRPCPSSLLRLIRLNPRFGDGCKIYSMGRGKRQILVVIQPEHGCSFYKFQSFASLVLLDWRIWLQSLRE